MHLYWSVWQVPRQGFAGLDLCWLQTAGQRSTGQLAFPFTQTLDDAGPFVRPARIIFSREHFTGPGDLSTNNSQFACLIFVLAFWGYRLGCRGKQLVDLRLELGQPAKLGIDASGLRAFQLQFPGIV